MSIGSRIRIPDVNIAVKNSIDTVFAANNMGFRRIQAIPIIQISFDSSSSKWIVFHQIGNIINQLDGESYILRLMKINIRR